MATTKPRAERPDKVDRAVAGIGVAVGRLVGLLGDENEAVMRKALTRISHHGNGIGGSSQTAPKWPRSG